MLRAFLACLAAMLSSQTGAALAGEQVVSREDQLRAAYLFNFMKFVEWPASSASDVLTVCFFGADAVREALAVDLEKKRVASRRLAVQALAAGENTADCNVVYIEGPAHPIETGAPILTVSDARNFVRRGGVIELFEQGNRLRFVVNVENARRAGLRISSMLLQLASRVEGADG